MDFNTIQQLSTIIRQKALSLGFSECGIARARVLSEHRDHLKEYLTCNRHGEMKFMEKHFEMRLNPELLFPGAKSVIVVLQNYYTQFTTQDALVPIISKYALGNDYHYVIKSKLSILLKYIQSIKSGINGRIFVDSAPVLERAWASLAGLGWIGKNTCLINKKLGSFQFIGGLMVDEELEDNQPQQNHCGTCQKCIDACPTKALIYPYQIDSRRCISYLTIEYKGEIPPEFKSKFQKQIFGCDICQDICPWNKKSLPHNEHDMKPNVEILKMNKKDWQDFDKLKFNQIFKKSPVKRTGYKAFRRNIDFIS